MNAINDITSFQILYQILNTLKNKLHTLCLDTLNNMDIVLELNALYKVSHGIMFLTILIYLLFSVNKMKKHKLNLYTFFKEYKRNIIPLIIVIIASIFSKNILTIIFNVNEYLFFDENSMNLIKHMNEAFNQPTLVSLIYSLMLTCVLLMTTILQILETVTLLGLLGLTPLFIIITINNPDRVHKLLYLIQKGIMTPVIQTVIIYVTVTIFLTIDTTIALRSLLILIVLSVSMRTSHLITDSLLIKNEQ